MGELIKRVLMYALGSVFARIVVGSGLAVVTYQGLTTLIPPLLNGIVSSLSSVSAEVVNILLLAGLGECLSIIGSAAIAAATMKAATVGLGLAS